jgi:hypothetical protein
MQFKIRLKMNKAILPLLVFCFALFSASAQVENKKPTTANQQTATDQSKISTEQMNKDRANEGTQVNPQINNPNAPVIKFDKMEHDYGTISQNAEGNCEFTFTNTGKEPLILSNVRGS